MIKAVKLSTKSDVKTYLFRSNIPSCSSQQSKLHFISNGFNWISHFKSNVNRRKLLHSEEQAIKKIKLLLIAKFSSKNTNLSEDYFSTKDHHGTINKDYEANDNRKSP